MPFQCYAQKLTLNISSLATKKIRVTSLPPSPAPKMYNCTCIEDPLPWRPTEELQSDDLVKIWLEGNGSTFVPIGLPSLDTKWIMARRNVLCSGVEISVMNAAIPMLGIEEEIQIQISWLF